MEVKVINKPNITKAIKLIERFKKLNMLKFDIEIILDYSQTDPGQYHYYPKVRRNKLYVNPDLCTTDFKLGYVNDCSTFTVIIHEFCHFIDYNIIKLFDKYKKLFPNNELIINLNCTSSLEEAFTELFSLYVINPYFLKHIDPARYYFFTEHILSPSPVTTRKFLSYYKNWTQPAKIECKKTWNLYVKNDKIINN